MRKILAFAAAASLAFAAAAPAFAGNTDVTPDKAPSGVYKLDARHASFLVKLTHFGFSHYTFRMTKFDAAITYNAADLTASSVKASIDPLSVYTTLPSFDKEIGEQFFGGKPISFVSKSLTKTSDTTGHLVGDLTLNGITKEVALDVTFVGGGQHPFNPAAHVIGLSATGVVKRSDFDIVKKYPDAVISDDVTIQIDAEFDK